jgi:hypothetical protein
MSKSVRVFFSAESNETLSCFKFNNKVSQIPTSSSNCSSEHKIKYESQGYLVLAMELNKEGPPPSCPTIDKTDDVTEEINFLGLG